MPFKLVLIGSGNLATALGKQLAITGQNILQVYSPTLDHANRLAKQLNCDATNIISNIHSGGDIYLVCVKDDVITPLSIQLARYLSSDKLIAHSSGVNSPEILDSTFQNRALFYPLQSFSGFKTPNWSQIPIFIEGNPHSRSVLSTLAVKLSTEVYVMNDKIRTHLHLASVFANNFTNYNLVIAKQILDKADVPLKVLNSLMTETVEKAFLTEPRNAQTGPAKRGDLQSIEKHIRLLVQEFPEYRSLYKKYSQIILQDFKHENPGPDTPS